MSHAEELAGYRAPYGGVRWWLSCPESMWSIFGKLIHSDRVTIDRSATPSPDGNETVGESAWAFNVASDKDKKGSSTLVFLEFLLGEFLDFERDLRRDLAKTSTQIP